MRQIEQLAPAMPGRQSDEGIRAEQQDQRLHGAEFIAHLPQRVDGIRRFAAIQFAGIESQAILPGQCRAQHRNALRGTCHRRGPVRRNVRWHQSYLRIERFCRFPRHAQMRVVHRIEGAAENGDGFIHGRFRSSARRATPSFSMPP